MQQLQQSSGERRRQERLSLSERDTPPSLPLASSDRRGQRGVSRLSLSRDTRVVHQGPRQHALQSPEHAPFQHAPLQRKALQRTPLRVPTPERDDMSVVTLGAIGPSAVPCSPVCVSACLSLCVGVWVCLCGCVGVCVRACVSASSLCLCVAGCPRMHECVYLSMCLCISLCMYTYVPMYTGLWCVCGACVGGWRGRVCVTHQPHTPSKKQKNSHKPAHVNLCRCCRGVIRAAGVGTKPPAHRCRSIGAACALAGLPPDLRTPHQLHTHSRQQVL